MFVMSCNNSGNSFIAIFIIVLIINGTNELLHRETRGIPLLLFPRTSPTRVQVSI